MAVCAKCKQKVSYTIGLDNGPQLCPACFRAGLEKAVAAAKRKGAANMSAVLDEAAKSQEASGGGE